MRYLLPNTQAKIFSLPYQSITSLGLSVHGARSIYIYRLAPCTENCSQKISKTFSHNNLEDVLLFCTFEPKKCKCAFRVAVSACTLKILCCGYNMATIKKNKKIKDYDTRSCSGMVISLSLRKQECKSANYAIYTLYYIHKKVQINHTFLGSVVKPSCNLSLSCT